MAMKVIDFNPPMTTKRFNKILDAYWNGKPITTPDDWNDMSQKQKAIEHAFKLTYLRNK